MHRTNFTIFFHLACACEKQGTVGNGDTCNDDGVCNCKANVEGVKCDKCLAGYFNFPACTGKWCKSTYMAQTFQYFFFPL